MADEDGDWSDVRDRGDAETDRRRDAESGRRRDAEADRRLDAETERRDHGTSAGIAGGFSFSLPPISLPEVRFPDRIRLFFPVPEPPERVSKPTRVRASRVLLVVVAVDALDALAAILAGPATLPWARAVVGTLLSMLFVGGAGLLYAWELLAILGGFGWVALAPTATALVLARALLSK